MGAFSLYLLKSVTSLSMLYCFYWFVLRNETYYKWNRLFLLISLLLSFLFPMFSFSIRTLHSGPFVNILNPVIINSYITAKEPTKSFDTLSILSIIYISGAVFFCLRFLSSLVKIHFLYYRFPKYKFNGFKAVVLDNDQSPFTFFNILFISRIDFESGKVDEIIVHEKAHQEEFHSFDILLLEVMTIIQWFSPFIWLFRHALKSEHEFIADNKVLLEGFDKVKYQKLLFERSLGITSFNLTNNFNYSLLKKRLKMMTIRKSSSLIKVKYLLSIPILLCAIMIMTVNINSYGQKEKDTIAVNPITEDSGNIEIFKFIRENIKYPITAKINKISATVYIDVMGDENGKVISANIRRTDIIDNLGKAILITGYNPKTNPKIDSKSVADMEAESKRVCMLLPHFYHGEDLKGNRIKAIIKVPISFVLSNVKDK